MPKIGLWSRRKPLISWEKTGDRGAKQLLMWIGATAPSSRNGAAQEYGDLFHLSPLVNHHDELETGRDAEN
jgi:hypothetical protein